MIVWANIPNALIAIHSQAGGTRRIRPFYGPLPLWPVLWSRNTESMPTQNMCGQGLRYLSHQYVFFFAFSASAPQHQLRHSAQQIYRNLRSTVVHMPTAKRYKANCNAPG